MTPLPRDLKSSDPNSDFGFPIKWTTFFTTQSQHFSCSFFFQVPQSSTTTTTMSRPPLQTPRCLAECIDPDTGVMCSQRYFLHQRLQTLEDSSSFLKEIIRSCLELADSESFDDTTTSTSSHSVSTNLKKKQKRYHTRSQVLYRNSDGSLQSLGPEDTSWFHDYVAVDAAVIDTPKFKRKFRQRFRMSYQSYQKHLQLVKECPLFSSWEPTALNAVGRPPVPLELLVLGTLRYLGRGWTLDDLEEATCISEETHRRFLHLYIFWGSTFLYDKYVTLPESIDQINDNSHEFFISGLPGAIGSQDATHVGMLVCHYKLKQYHDSFKLPMPSRTYNITVNHRRRILSSTRGHPGRWNDKTLVLYDDLSTAVREGTKFGDLEFDLWESDSNGGEPKKVKYKGAWIIVDGGYLDWPTMVPPLKRYATYKERRFSKWLESMRKDVECTFGIMKGRFRILKTGIPLHGIEATDRIWATCCALHNFLLEEDGKDSSWNMNLYMSEDGHHDDNDIEKFVCNQQSSDVFYRRRGITNADRAMDTSGMGPGVTGRIEVGRGGDNVLQAPVVVQEVSSNGKIVRNLTLQHFREKLIDNFDILWKQNKVKWPSRTGLGKKPEL